MKKAFSFFIILPVLGAISISTLASSYTPFNNMYQAAVYCPPVSGLTFTPANPNTTNSQGTISGTKSPASFKSPGFVMHPKNIEENGKVQNVSFREANGIYGYISGNKITCLYSYPGFTGVNVALILEGTQ